MIGAPKLVVDVRCRCPIYTFGFYQGSLSGAIKAVKYKPSRKLLHRLAFMVEAAAQNTAKDIIPEILIPVPLHFNRESMRGFNQAYEFGKVFAETWGIPITPVLKRVRATKPQAECDENERATNLADAFALAEGLKKDAFLGKRLCLVDDVATTGATLDACAAVLTRLNPSSLQAFVIAHSAKIL